MGSPSAIPESLWTFLYGRRDHRRFRVDLEARLHGPCETVRAHVVDVSAGGLLLCVARVDLLPPRPRVRGGGLVGRNFGVAVRVELPEVDLDLEADVARLAWRPDDLDHVYAGCRFPRPLGERALQRLGIPRDAGSREAGGGAPSALLPLQTPDGEPFTVQVHEAGGDLVVPLFEGPLAGAGQQTLAARIPDAQLDGVATRLDGRTLAIHVSRGLEAVWTVTARILAIRPLPVPERGVEIVLLADSSPADFLTGCLERRDEVDTGA